MKFTKSKNFEKPDYVNEAMETLNLSEDYKDEKEALYYYTDDSVAMVFP